MRGIKYIEFIDTIKLIISKDDNIKLDQKIVYSEVKV
jgi:hypothetical protein